MRACSARLRARLTTTRIGLVRLFMRRHPTRRRSQSVVDTSVADARIAALPVSAGDRKRFDWGVWRCGCPDLGVPGLAPCPPIAAGSAIGRAGQGPGGSPAGVAGAVGVLDAAAREWIMPGSGGREQRRAAGGG